MHASARDLDSKGPMRAAAAASAAAAAGLLGWLLQRYNPLGFYLSIPMLLMSWLPLSRAIRRKGYHRAVTLGGLVGYGIVLVATW